jgi:hypothetical protein
VSWRGEPEAGVGTLPVVLAMAALTLAVVTGLANVVTPATAQRWVCLVEAAATLDGDARCGSGSDARRPGNPYWLQVQDKAPQQERPRTREELLKMLCRNGAIFAGLHLRGRKGWDPDSMRRSDEQRRKRPPEPGSPLTPDEQADAILRGYNAQLQNPTLTPDQVCAPAR